MGETQYPIATISGSMRFFNEMIEVANQWTGDGYIILMPFVHVIKPEDQENNPIKEMLDDMHFTKISMSDLVLVVTGPDFYIGKSTKNEIDYAKEHGIEVKYV
jgi:hypothetical protein